MLCRRNREAGESLPSPGRPAYPGSFTGCHSGGEGFLAEGKADPRDDRVPSLGLALRIFEENTAHVAAPPVREIAPAVECVGVPRPGDREKMPRHSGVLERVRSEQKMPSEIGSRAAPRLVGQRVDDEPRTAVLGSELLAGTENSAAGYSTAVARAESKYVRQSGSRSSAAVLSRGSAPTAVTNGAAARASAQVQARTGAMGMLPSPEERRRSTCPQPSSITEVPGLKRSADVPLQPCD